MHRVFEIGDVGVLGNVVDRCAGATEANLTPFLVVDIYV